MADYKPFDPEKFTAMFGTHKVRGYGEDAMVEVSFDSDFGEVHKSVDGENRHVVLKDRAGTITVTLGQHSASNGVFTTLVASGVPFPVTLSDKSSVGDTFFAGSTKIKTMPTFTKGKSNTENVWVWQFTRGTMTLAGAFE
jgi:hypothetical protein